MARRGEAPWRDGHPVVRPGSRGRRALSRPDPDRHHQLRRPAGAGRAEGGRARRHAARRGGDRVRAVGGRARSQQRGGAMGRRPGRAAAAARPPRRGACQRRRLAGPPVLRRDPGRHGVGPRRGRHEGLRRDAALDGAGARPGRRRAHPAARALLHRRRGGGRHQGCRAARRPASRPARGLPRGGRGGRRLQHDGAGPPALPDRGRREGHGLDADDRQGNAGHGSMVHPDNAVTSLAAAVARIGQHEWPVRLTPTMQVLLAAVAELAGTEATPGERRGAGRGVRSARPDARRRASATRPTRPCSRPATRSTWSRPRRPPTSTAGSCPATRTSSWRPWPSCAASPTCGSSYLTKLDGLETPYDGRWSRR